MELGGRRSIKCTSIHIFNDISNMLNSGRCGGDGGLVLLEVMAVMLVMPAEGDNSLN